MGFEGIGASVRRREDVRFLSGRGNYTDDINRPAAAAAPGVVAVYTGADMAKEEIGGLPCGWQIHSKDGSPMAEPPHPVLAVDRVRYVGDPVAVVIVGTPGPELDA